MPQILVLDRHKVTLIERQKAAKLAEQEKQTYKKPTKKKASGLIEDPHKGFSKGEKDLYIQVNKLNRTVERTRAAEEQKTLDVRNNLISYWCLVFQSKADLQWNSCPYYESSKQGRIRQK
jgi:hypothetical protein